MFRLHLNFRRPSRSGQTPDAMEVVTTETVQSPRRGITLVELLMAAAITGMLSVVLGGLAAAVHTARSHAEGFEDATYQAQATIDRIRYMVSHAGTYQIDQEAVQVGLAVVPHQWALFELPDVLVVWSGGGSGGMATAGLQHRLPRVNELVIYAADPTTPTRFEEVTIPGDSSEIDFRASDFRQRILTFINSAAAERVLLCDRIRASQLEQFAWYAAVKAPNVRFEIVQTPTDDELNGTSPGTQEWNRLQWAQGISTTNSGLRQATVRIELQLETQRASPATAASRQTALPFFGSVGYQYLYRH